CPSRLRWEWSTHGQRSFPRSLLMPAQVAELRATLLRGTRATSHPFHRLTSLLRSANRSRARFPRHRRQLRVRARAAAEARAAAVVAAAVVAGDSNETERPTGPHLHCSRKIAITLKMGSGRMALGAPVS